MVTGDVEKWIPVDSVWVDCRTNSLNDTKIGHLECNTSTPEDQMAITVPGCGETKKAKHLHPPSILLHSFSFCPQIAIVQNWSSVHFWEQGPLPCQVMAPDCAKRSGVINLARSSKALMTGSSNPSLFVLPRCPEHKEQRTSPPFPFPLIPLQ
eukprot:EG_transcript_24929